MTTSKFSGPGCVSVCAREFVCVNIFTHICVLIRVECSTSPQMTTSKLLGPVVCVCVYVCVCA